MINTNLPPILHRFQVMANNNQIIINNQIFAARAECLTLSLSLGVTPANIAINDISLKTSMAYISAAESTGVSSTTFT